jgi:hypothetical protein
LAFPEIIKHAFQLPHAALGQRRQAAPHSSVENAGFLKELALDREAKLFVEGDHLNLGVEIDFGEVLSLKLPQEPLHQLTSDALSSELVEDGHSSDFRADAPSRADDSLSALSDHMPRIGIMLVSLELLRHTLLLDKNAPPYRKDCGTIIL